MSWSAHRRRRIAIVGSGVSGLTCAHLLGPHHDVVLYEADGRLGGHANTVDVDDPAVGRLAVDTGFIVHNDRNYPNLTQLFEELEVATRDTSMSFAVTDRLPGSATSGLTYRATSPNSLFAQRRNLARPAMWRMLADIARFYREAARFLADPDATATLDDFLDEHRFAGPFIDLHLMPMGAAVWSADPSTFGRYPALSLLRFLDHHGLLAVGDRPQWKVIPGGSRVYVDALARRFDGEIRLGQPVHRVRRDESGHGVDVVTADTTERFDDVVIAAHSDQALRMIDRPTALERELLSSIRYQPNTAVLHTDAAMLPPVRRAWAAWNYDRRRPSGESGPATVTYDLTALQHLPGARRYLLSLNSDEWVRPEAVIQRFQYAHPVYDLAAVDAQRRIDEIDGRDRISFCGAWRGNGFHEDGALSARRVCDRLGVAWDAVGEVAA
jgi:predicted NAD/FAD-binding protein